MKKFAAMFAVLLALIVASSACAVDDVTPKKFGIKLTVFEPIGSELKEHGLKAIWYGFGADYYLKNDEDGRPTREASLGYAASGDDLLKGSVIPMTYTVINRKPISANRSKYIGYGAGLYYVKLKFFNPQTGVKFGKTNIKPGVHILYGQEFNEYFGELRLDLVTKMTSIHTSSGGLFPASNWSGVRINVGARF